MFQTILATFIGLGLVLSIQSAKDVLPYPCDSEIYCHGELLETVQLRRIYEDSKTFVDMKLKENATVTLEKFRAFMEAHGEEPTDEDVKNFVETNFDGAGSEFEDWIPDDWTANPKFATEIKSEAYRNFSLHLNDIWKDLGRKMKLEVEQNQELYSIIYVPNPVIVPGGRFREFYYWDSYWIVKGLLLSEMTSTVRGMLSNFAYIIENHGHIPNGGRIYYEQRSQPPLYLPMVKLYEDATQDKDFIKENIATFELEFNYWLNNYATEVNLNGITYTLLKYGDYSQGPRPESYAEDYTSAKYLPEAERQEYYSELKAAAESGWDFSSRWFINNGTNKGNLTNIKTRQIVPVDLNAIMYWNAVLLRDWYAELGNAEKVSVYENRANELLEAVEKVLWNEETGVWLDYDQGNGAPRKYFYSSNLVPLWTKCYDVSRTTEIVTNVLAYMKNEGVVLDGGVPTSLEQTGEQWDYPNAWPPLQHMIILGLDDTGVPEAQSVAYELADRWVKSNYIAYTETEDMFEKYDATTLGGHGGGGEYEVQLGFGWTNGVILDLLNRYGKQLDHTTRSSAPETKVLGHYATLFVALIATTLAGYIG